MGDIHYMTMTLAEAHGAQYTDGPSVALENFIPGVKGTGADPSGYIQGVGTKKTGGGAWWGAGGGETLWTTAVAMRFDGFKSIEDVNANKPSYVRRPMSGIAVKPNTHAFLQVVHNRSKQIVKVFNDIGSVTSTPADNALATIPAGEVDTSSLKYIAAQGVLKADPTNPAALKIVNPPTARLKTATGGRFDHDAPRADRWTDWFLQQVVEIREEKFQITDTFGETAFNAFGQRPRLLSFKGYLLNTSDFNWRAEFWHNWDHFFRATKLIEKDCQVYIGFDDIVVSGYPINATTKQLAEAPNMIMFQFNFFVTSYTNMSMKNIGQMQAMRTSSLGLSDKKPVFLDRSNEFIRTGDFSYGDWSSPRGQTMMSTLSKTFGGKNMAFKDMIKGEAWKWVMGGLGVAAGVGVMLGAVANSPDDAQGGVMYGIAAVAGALAGAEGFTNPMGGILFDSALTYIKGTNTMMEYINSRISGLALQATNQWTMETAKDKKGHGLPGVNFWFGFVGHLYKAAAVNGMKSFREPSDDVYDIGKAGAEGYALKAGRNATDQGLSNNRWLALADHAVQMGTMQGVTSYLGYAASAVMNETYKTAMASGGGGTSYMEAAGLEYDIDVGFYAATGRRAVEGIGNNHNNKVVDPSGLSYGADISWSNYGGLDYDDVSMKGRVGEMQIGNNFGSDNNAFAANLPPATKKNKEYWQAQADMYADPQWSNPEKPAYDPEGTNNSLIKDLMTEKAYKDQKEKEAVYMQNKQNVTSDGALVPIIKTEAAEDDGTEENVTAADLIHGKYEKEEDEPAAIPEDQSGD